MSRSPRIRLLGIPGVRTEGGWQIEFRSHRIPALLGYLASHPGPRRRERVAEALWPHRDEQEGRHNLRQTILYARRLLGDEVLVGNRKVIELQEESDVSLLLEYQNALGSSEEREALCERITSLPYGDFLEGFDDDWLFGVRARCADAYVGALLALANHSIPEVALGLSDRAISIAPLMDEARAARIRILRRNGEEHAARREFESYRELLAKELALEPSRLVSEALEEERELPSRPQAPIETTVSLLLDSHRPSQGVNLATAFVPAWILEGRVEVGIATLTQALERCPGHEPGRPELGLAALYAAASRFYESRSVLDEVLRDAIDSATRFRALIMRCRQNAAFFRTAEAEADIAPLLAEIDGQPIETQVDGYRCAAEVAYQLRKTTDCERYCLKCIRLANRIADWEASASCAIVLAFARFREGRTEEALDAAHGALAQLKERRTPKAAFTRVRIYRFLEEVGNVEEAIAGYRAGVEESRRLKDFFGYDVALTYLGDALTKMGRYEEALLMHRRALESRMEHPEPLGIATSYRGIACALTGLNRSAEAREAAQNSSRIFLENRDMPGHASSLLVLSDIAEYSGDQDLARRLASRAHDILLATIPPEKPDDDLLQRAARRRKYLGLS